MRPLTFGFPTSAAVALLVLAVSGCDGEPITDAGLEDAGFLDAGHDSSVTVCAADRDCDDGLFCNGEETCNPGAAGASADGCVAGTAPCAAAACDESSGSCSCGEDADMDNDGIDSIACGGTDCDDDDPNRYPGNGEVCDAEGHDEDCDPSTVGDRDEDSDGFVDAACCNGDVCGDDCDDGDININPGATETCNGVDDSCSGVADDGGSLCPGGLCVAGGCQFDAWDRAFGGTNWDFAQAVALDSLGNVYVGGFFRESVDFGDGPVTTSREAQFVVSYRPDGAYRWAWVGPDEGFFGGGLRDVAVTPDGSRVFAVGGENGVDFGSGVVDGAYVIELDGTSGAYLDDRRFGAVGTSLDAAKADATGVVVAGRFAGSVDWGGGERTAAGGSAMVVARYDLTLSYVWDASVSATGAAPGREAMVRSVDLRGDGSVVLGGSYADGALPLAAGLADSGAGREVAFIAELDASGAPVWASAVPATFGNARGWGVAALTAGGAVLVGDVVGTVNPGTGDPPYSATDFNGIIMGFDAAGTPEWFRGFGSAGGLERASAVAEDGMGPVVVGHFSTDTSFGGATRRPTGTEGFVARYTPSGSHRNDTRYGSGGSLFVRDVAVGPGGSTVIVGTFDGVANFGGGATVSQSIDAFILRLGS